MSAKKITANWNLAETAIVIVRGFDKWHIFANGDRMPLYNAAKRVEYLTTLNLKAEAFPVLETESDEEIARQVECL